MTRLPTESRAVKGLDGPPYELNVVCAKPGCQEYAQDPHHCWRRSETIGPYWYVHVEEDDAIVGNVVGLCSTHHHAVTVNAAWIKWEDGRYTWTDLFSASEPLSFQPPVRLVEEALPNAPEKNGGGIATNDPPQASSEAPVPAQAPLDGTCPTCLRPLPHPKSEHEPKRQRRTWSVTVPVDEREDGADTIDTLLEEGRRELAKAGLPYGDTDAAIYFVLSTVLALFVQHAEDVLA